MPQLTFVYGTLLRGEVNHRLLADAELLGSHRTKPCLTLYRLGAYPGAVRGGKTAVSGEVYRLDVGMLQQLDRLEDYPRLYTGETISTAFGRAWIYIYRGHVAGRPVIVCGDWRDLTRTPGSVRSAAVRNRRDPKNPGLLDRLSKARTSAAPILSQN
jgi:gamma-glutamylcyclotransferase (GGCT)/AIG2-like uncharacterized protein YtfP